jgi:hypothetical protein
MPHPHAVSLILGARALLAGHREREPSTGVFTPTSVGETPGAGFTNISVRIKKAALL